MKFDRRILVQHIQITPPSIPRGAASSTLLSAIPRHCLLTERRATYFPRRLNPGLSAALSAYPPTTQTRKVGSDKSVSHQFQTRLVSDDSGSSAGVWTTKHLLSNIQRGCYLLYKPLSVSWLNDAREDREEQCGTNRGLCYEVGR